MNKLILPYKREFDKTPKITKFFRENHVENEKIKLFLLTFPMVKNLCKTK